MSCNINDQVAGLLLITISCQLHTLEICSLPFDCVEIYGVEGVIVIYLVSPNNNISKNKIAQYPILVILGLYKIITLSIGANENLLQTLPAFKSRND